MSVDREQPVSLGGEPAVVTGQEQWLYARWLSLGMRTGLVMAMIGWCLSAWPGLGGQDPAALLRSLRQPARVLTEGMAFPLIGSGPGAVVALAGIGLLAACALPALLGLLPLARRQHDRVLIGLALGQAGVLLVGMASAAFR